MYDKNLKSIGMTALVGLLAVMVMASPAMAGAVTLQSLSGTGFDTTGASTTGTVSYSSSGVQITEGGSYTSETFSLSENPDALDYDVGSIGDHGTNPTITAYDGSDDSQIASASLSSTGTGSIDLTGSSATSVYFTISVPDDSDGTTGETMTMASVDYTAQNDQPVADFTDSDNTKSVSTGTSVTLDASASSDPDSADTLTYTWDLDGDGTFGDTTGSTATVSESSTGTYNYDVKVKDGNGASDTATFTLDVTDSTGGTGTSDGSIPTQMIAIIGVVAIGVYALFKAEK